MAASAFPPTGARHRGGAPRRTWLGLVAPSRGIIHIYFFLRGASSHEAANFGHFSVRCNAASGIAGQWGDEGPALAHGQWSEGPQRDRHHRRSSSSALLPIFEFVTSLAPFGARKGPVNGPEAVLRVKFCDRGRAGGVAPLTKPGTAPDFRAARGALLTLGVEAQAGHLFPVGSWLEVRDRAHGNRHAQFERVRVHESDDPKALRMEGPVCCSQSRIDLGEWDLQPAPALPPTPLTFECGGVG